MATDRYPRFDNLATLSAYLLESMEDLQNVRGFVVDKKNGIVTPCDEFRHGSVTEIYSEEVKQQFKLSVETALVMSMQMLLLTRLAEHLKEEKVKTLVEKHRQSANTATLHAVYPLAGFIRDLAPRRFGLFSAQPASPVERVIYQVLMHHQRELSSLASLNQVNEIMKHIQSKVDQVQATPNVSLRSKRG